MVSAGQLMQDAIREFELKALRLRSQQECGGELSDAERTGLIVERILESMREAMSYSEDPRSGGVKYRQPG
jgi:hypothetical protein